MSNEKTALEGTDDRRRKLRELIGEASALMAGDRVFDSDRALAICAEIEALFERASSHGLQHCPICDHQTECQSSLDPERPNIKPKLGDIGVCLYCTVFYEFGPGGEPIPLTGEKLAELPKDARKTLLRARAYITQMQLSKEVGGS